MRRDAQASAGGGGAGWQCNGLRGQQGSSVRMRGLRRRPRLRVRCSRRRGDTWRPEDRGWSGWPPPGAPAGGERDSVPTLQPRCNGRGDGRTAVPEQQGPDWSHARTLHLTELEQTSHCVAWSLMLQKPAKLARTLCRPAIRQAASSSSIATALLLCAMFYAARMKPGFGEGADRDNSGSCLFGACRPETPLKRLQSKMYTENATQLQAARSGWRHKYPAGGKGQNLGGTATVTRYNNTVLTPLTFIITKKWSFATVPRLAWFGPTCSRTLRKHAGSCFRAGRRSAWRWKTSGADTPAKKRLNCCSKTWSDGSTGGEVRGAVRRPVQLQTAARRNTYPATQITRRALC